MATDIEFWSRPRNSKSSNFSLRVDPSGLALYSSNNINTNKIGDYNDNTIIFARKRYQQNFLNNTKYTSSSTVKIYAQEAESEKVSFTSKGFSTFELITLAPSRSDTSTINLNKLPNYLSSFNIRLISDSVISTSNVEIKLVNPSSTGLTPSGIDFKLAEVIHPSTNKTIVGSGDSSWTSVDSHTTALGKSLTSNPGVSGQVFGVSSNRHDWFVAMSCVSLDVGSKDFDVIFSVEYT